MASRKPLVPRNRDVGREGGKPTRRERYRFALLSKAALVDQVNMILGQADVSVPQLNITEDDLANPTSFKICQVYYACFVEVFGVSPDLNFQPSFIVDHHPELMAEFSRKIQFFRLMKRLMEDCSVPDFQLTDIVNPDTKRTCRNLSAILNFIKFHVHMAREDQEQEEAIGPEMAEYAKRTHENQELKQKLASLQQQKLREQEHEDELRLLMTRQDELVQVKLEQEVALQQRLHDLKGQVLKEQQKKALLGNELDKVSQRIDDLCKQIVSSPDKLRNRLIKLQKEVEEIKAETHDSDILKRLWESLATRAQHIPNVLRGLNEDMELLITKTNKASDLQTHLTEAVEEKIARQKQLLKEVTAKNQNLDRHVKYVEKEAQQVAYDSQQLVHSHPKSDLERDINHLKTQVHSIEVADEEYTLQIEEIIAELETQKLQHKAICLEIQSKLADMVTAVQVYVQKGQLS